MDLKTDIQQLCTESCCVDGDDDRKIKCSKCKRSVHFICKNLPMYQLRLFHTKNYQGFNCVNCIELPCLLYTSPSPRDKRQSRMPSSA